MTTARAKSIGQAWTRLLVATLPAWLFGLMIWERRWNSDDGFINIRIVDNLLAGHGPVYNVGERIEAYTSPLWVAILTLVGLLRIPVDVGSVVCGLLLSVAGMLFATLGAAQLFQNKVIGGANLCKVSTLPLGMLIYAAIPVAWEYGTSGLETSLSLAWMGGSFLLVARLVARVESQEAERKGPWYLLSFVVGLGPLVRPELALYSLGFCLPIVFGGLSTFNKKESLKTGLVVALCMGLLPLAYQVFRMGFFAAAIPNTAIAKLAFKPRWDQGGHFFQNFFGLYYLLVPLVLMLLPWSASLHEAALSRRWMRLSLRAVPAVIGAAYALYVVRSGGGFMHGRMFLPALFGMLLPVATLPLRSSQAWPSALYRRVIAAVVIIWAVACALWLRMPKENYHGIGDERGWYARMAKVKNPVRLADYSQFAWHSDAARRLEAANLGCQKGWKDANCKRFVYFSSGFGSVSPMRKRYDVSMLSIDPRIIGVDTAGALGIYGNVLGPKIHVVDPHGLSDPIASRLIIHQRGRPGHERRMQFVWVVARFAQASLADSARLKAARRALGCGELKALLAAVTAPLTAKRFFSNMRSAFRLQRIRIPQSPILAERQFCR